MKISTPEGARTRALSMKVDGKKPKGWKDGDEIPRHKLTAEFDEHGNADVSDECGKAMVAAYDAIKEGHNKVPESTEKKE